MAGHTCPQCCDPQAEELDRYLAGNGFSGPAPPDLDRIQEALSLLKERLSIGVPPISSSDASKPDILSPGEATGADPTKAVVTAQTARRNASPVVNVFPVGAFAIGVPSQGESLRIIGFGTISVDVYEELVWEVVQQLPGYTSLETKVYEVNKTGGKLRFEILFQNQVFEFLYFHSETLVRSMQQTRSRPGILKVEDCEADALEALEEVRQSFAKKRLFATCPSYPRTYYTIRTWAILKGLWNGSHSKDVIGVFAETLDGAQLDYDAMMATIFGGSILTSRPQPYPGSSPQDWSEVLTALGNTSILERMDAKCCVVINTTVGGCSNTAAGKWLSLVERRLPRLVQLIQSTSTEREPTDLEPFVTLWPNRLTFDSDSEHIESQAGVYESCFLVGLSSMPNSEQRLKIDDVADKWMTSILNHEYTLEGRTIMSTQLLPASDERLKSLSACPRIFPRASLPAPNPRKDDNEETKEDIHKKTKKNKGKHSSFSNVSSSQVSLTHHDSESAPAELPAGKFPTATQVHNRLKHDSVYNIEEYMIGYKDFDTIAEMPAENWVRETTDEAFVPESRVKYFARYAKGLKEVVWDRERRIDGMFRKG